MTSRRQFLAAAGAVPAWLASGSPAASGPPKLGGAPTAFSLRSRSMGRAGFDIVEHGHNIGLGGVETLNAPPATDAEAIKKLRGRLEAYGMYLVCNPRLPQQPGDVEAFDAQIKACKDVGAAFVHAAMTGRRYEDFSAFEPWKAMFERSQKQVELAEPVLKKYKIKLGVENHKGWRAAEQAAWMKRLSGEWGGVCLDFGNNMSLCEDPMDTLKTLLPYIVYAHIKDMGVEEYEDGFLLSEVVTGDGCLDLKGMVSLLRQKDPNMIFELEMITRDPLRIPVYTPKYWATFQDSSPLSGQELAKMLALVKKNKPKKPLPKTSGLAPEAQLKLEDDLNNQCIAWCRQNLNM
jgi:3-oxoisoapionate decarboxylase